MCRSKYKHVGYIHAKRPQCMTATAKLDDDDNYPLYHFDCGGNANNDDFLVHMIPHNLSW